MYVKRQIFLDLVKSCLMYFLAKVIFFKKCLPKGAVVSTIFTADFAFSGKSSKPYIRNWSWLSDFLIERSRDGVFYVPTIALLNFEKLWRSMKKQRLSNVYTFLSSSKKQQVKIKKWKPKLSQNYKE